ncbi:acylphosphatase [Mesorhizobium australicum WSM2073]|uniref:acylphosphatase n=1 Tax=Mesorhizobium australicum (strain HAMBI 3006 / LMG 24608 / WSM2073) TaxID=754035 RepID=L0KRB0_MESAW|nr:MULTISPECIES: acylphosphatase [Mesorhizobium]AGB47220.1 acylphosphatase [Mesorhizobium australicum WSM2073]MBZ9977797.1 acylphosphatase [Mesorhizobium sp. BR-1-1-10]
MNDRKRAVQAHIYGTVQGVGYRAWMRDEATRLGLLGWVRNERDRSVTAWLTGADAAIAAMIERLRQGPPGAAVSRIDVEELETWATPGDFRIIG